MEFLAVTNNPAVAREYPDCGLTWVDGGVDEVYRLVRDLVHRGHRLLTHPLSSSLKPGRIPYKTVLLTAQPQGILDLESLEYIAAAMAALAKTRLPGPLNLPLQVLADYAEVDRSIFESALESLRAAP